MSTGVFAPFSIPSYRNQWSADVLSAWGFEMETLMIGWYVLVETDSALAVAIVSALRFAGTLIGPFAGVVADRVARRNLLLAMRAVFVVLGGAMALVGLQGVVPIWFIFIVATVAGLLRPSEMMVRQSLVADTVPRNLLANAMGFTRTTMDSARIAGAIAGAGLLSQVGLGPAYVVVTLMYVCSAVLTLRIPVLLTQVSAAAPLKEFKEGLAYIRDSRLIIAIMGLAFLVNLTSFPATGGLMPVIARDVFGFDANGLAKLITAFASGALIGSLGMAVLAKSSRPIGLMFGGLLTWHVCILIFAQITSPVLAYVALFAIGASTSVGMIAMSVVLMMHTDIVVRGRVMGVRMLAVYGLPVGLVIAGVLIEATDVNTTISIHASIGLAVIAFAAIRWRHWMAKQT